MNYELKVIVGAYWKMARPEDLIEDLSYEIDYRVGDVITFIEWDAEGKAETGRSFQMEITGLSDGAVHRKAELKRLN